MKYLLDTMTWFWLCERPELVPSEVIASIDEAGVPFLSVASVWEIARKTKLSQRKPAHPSGLKLSVPLKTWMAKSLDGDALTVLLLTPQIAVEANELPGDFHDDPMDQIIVATARVQNLTVVTSDTLIKKYKHVKSLYFKGPALPPYAPR